MTESKEHDAVARHKKTVEKVGIETLFRMDVPTKEHGKLNRHDVKSRVRRRTLFNRRHPSLEKNRSDFIDTAYMQRRP